MLPARATEADSEIALALVNVVGKQIYEQFRDAADEFLGLRKGPDVFGDSRMPSREGAKLRHKMRVRQKAHVEHQVGVVGHSVFESEADTGNKNCLLRTGCVLEAVGQVRAQLVDVELRGVDDQIGKGANGTQMTALGRQRGAHSGANSEGMRAARLAEAAEQN